MEDPEIRNILTDPVIRQVKKQTFIFQLVDCDPVVIGTDYG